MLTLGPNEALCVVLFAFLVWAAHAILKVAVPIGPALSARPGPFGPAALLACAAALAAGAALGRFFLYPLIAHPSLRWTAVAAPALALLAVPLSYYAVRPSLPKLDHPARRFIWMTPLAMLVAALATPSTDVFPMTVVFLPACVGCMAGVGVAELSDAVARQSPMPMSRVLTWGLRFGAESILGAGVCLLILTRGR